MSSLSSEDRDVKPGAHIEATLSALEGKTSFIWGFPVDEMIAVRGGKAEWLPMWSESKAPCCPAFDPEPCISCRVFEPTGPLAQCPRCNGLGLRQFDGFDGPIVEECTSCLGSGEVDDATARTIEALMDRAHAEADERRRMWEEECEAEYESRWTITQKTLPEMIAVEIGRYRSMGTPFGELLADRIRGLLTVVEALDATTVEDYVDRRDTMLAGL